MGCIGVSIIMDRLTGKLDGLDHHVMPTCTTSERFLDSTLVTEDYCIDMHDGSFLWVSRNGIGMRQSSGNLQVRQYEFKTVFKKKIPICIDKCYESIISEYGYVMCNMCSRSGEYCQDCHNFSFLVPCKYGDEKSNGSTVLLSPEKLEQYLMSYNRLHCMQHLLYVLNYLYR